MEVNGGPASTVEGYSPPSESTQGTVPKPTVMLERERFVCFNAQLNNALRNSALLLPALLSSDTVAYTIAAREVERWLNHKQALLVAGSVLHYVAAMKPDAGARTCSGDTDYVCLTDAHVRGLRSEHAALAAAGGGPVGATAQATPAVLPLCEAAQSLLDVAAACGAAVPRSRTDAGELAHLGKIVQAALQYSWQGAVVDTGSKGVIRIRIAPLSGPFVAAGGPESW